MRWNIRAVLFKLCDHGNDLAVVLPHHAPEINNRLWDGALRCYVLLLGLHFVSGHTKKTEPKKGEKEREHTENTE